MNPIRKRRAAAGFTLIEIMIATALVALLAVLATPSAIRARTTAARDACIANLRQIQNAKEQWAVENNKSTTETAVDSELFGLDKYLKTRPKCPDGGTYSINSNDTPPSCSIPGHT